MTAGPSPIRAFGASDGDLRHLEGRTIAVIGYGNQGRAQALNLRDSGVRDIVVGTARDATWNAAEADGFPVRPVPEAVRDAGIIFLLIPDEELPAAFPDEIAPGLAENAAIVFASGYNLAFAGITPPANVDVLLLAPRMIGRQMRKLFEDGKGFYSYVAVEQDASGRAWETLLALAKGIGTLAPGGGALELSAHDETLLDLFHEQGFGSILATTFMLMLEIGVEAGLPAEAMVLDLYLSGEGAETLQTMADLGFAEQALLHSRTSQYGGMMRTLGIDREPLRKHLQQIIDEVRSGAFARQWAAEQSTGAKQFEQIRALAGSANPFTPIERRLRAALDEAQKRGKGDT